MHSYWCWQFAVYTALSRKNCFNVLTQGKHALVTDLQRKCNEWNIPLLTQGWKKLPQYNRPHAMKPEQSCICLPISAFADNLDFKVVDPTGSGDWVCGSHWCCILVVLTMACKRRNTRCTLRLWQHYFMWGVESSREWIVKICGGIHLYWRELSEQ